MINLLISGIGGKMGAHLIELCQDNPNINLVCGVDIYTPKTDVPVYRSFNSVLEQVDVVIDFSSPAVLDDMLTFAKNRRCALVIATTGYTKEQLESIEEATMQVAIFRTANFSLGVNVLVKLVNQAASILGEGFDIEIVEKHHNLKKDAPSGTALMLADSANSAFNNQKDYLFGREGIVGARGDEIGIHAVRGGTIVGEHDVLFCGEDEIITLSHSARSKRVFAVGAIKAAMFIVGKPAGKYAMEDMIKL